MALRSTIVTFIVISLLFGCIDPLDYKPENNNPVLTVEGFVTTEAGPYTVRLTKSARYVDVTLDVISPIETAKVTIRDDSGENIICIYDQNGYYITPTSFRGEIGKRYSLHIIVDDKTYLSNPMEIKPTVEVDSIFHIFSEVPTISSSGNLSSNTGVDLYVDYPKSEENYDLWSYEGIFYIRTNPENFTFSPFPGAPPLLSPKTCCNECWKTENGPSSNAIFVGKNSLTPKTFNIIDNGYRFIDKYKISLAQYSIDQESFNFFNSLKILNQVDGDIFDPPPLQLGRNIYNIDDPEEVVVGFFYASDVKRYIYEIKGSTLDFRQAIPVYDDDCRTLSRTSETPPTSW